MIRGAPIDLALEIIEMIRPAGVAVTLNFIAEICREIDSSITVRHQDIFFLQQRALEKLRKAMGNREPVPKRGEIPRRYRLAREAAAQRGKESPR